MLGSCAHLILAVIVKLFVDNGFVEIIDWFVCSEQIICLAFNGFV